jgi:hypothetical protein
MPENVPETAEVSPAWLSYKKAEPCRQGGAAQRQWPEDYMESRRIWCGWEGGVG